MGVLFSILLSAGMEGGRRNANALPSGSLSAGNFHLPPKSALGGEPEGPPPKAHHLDLYKVRGYFFVTLRERLKFAGWFCAKDRKQAAHSNHYKTASPREGKPKFRTGRAFSPHPKLTNHPHPAPGSPPGHRAGRSSCPPGRYGWGGAVGESPPKRLRPVPVRSSQTPPSSLFAG